MMESKLRCCTNNPDIRVFCYICGECVMKDQRKRINDTVIRLYSAYFGIEMGCSYDGRLLLGTYA